MMKSSINTILTSVRNITEVGPLVFIKKYWPLCVLALLVLLSIITLIILVTIPVVGAENKNSGSFKTTRDRYDINIYVDISGSVKNPRVYKITSSTRLYELLEKAGGLTEQADSEFISRNINFAQILSDGQKVYFPSKNETLDKVFVENQKILSQVNPGTNAASHDTADLVSINTASADEIESLPGIGEVTREKIIKGRPYKSLDDLVLRGIVNQSVFNKIQDSIAL